MITYPLEELQTGMIVANDVFTPWAADCSARFYIEPADDSTHEILPCAICHHFAQ